LQGPQAQPAILAQAMMNSGYFDAQQIPAHSTQAVWRDYGGVLARSGLLEDSLWALDIALLLKPDCYASLIDAGTAQFTLGRLEPAAKYFDRAAKLRPDDPGPKANLAAIHARQGKAAKARDQANRAIALNPALLTAHLALARADLIDGRADQAEAIVSGQLERADITDQNRIALLDLRAEIRDAANRCDAAFSDYADRNRLLIRVNEARIGASQTEREIDQAVRIADYFHNHVNRWARWPADQDEAAPRVRRHVFLVGFPRSGTTLVEKALAGHPDIVTLEEIDSLHGLSAHWTADESRLGQLVTESPGRTQLETARACRAAYWDKVRAATGTGLTGKSVIDKMPLYSLQLPVIARLFPDAQILFALRDPRDVVLSCFRRRFRINAAMFEFLTLEGTARYYDAVMKHARRCREILPLRFFDMRHEAIVENFDGEIRSILGFLDLDWDDSVRRFSERAALRPFTPSDPQLVRGLSSEGVGQWRRYRSALAPVSGILAPWVASYGYAHD
jgi:tetratricopeptide (TPR) repeat protein